nr:hypothetical protein [uncultured Sphaerochaeta sp.]
MSIHLTVDSNTLGRIFEGIGGVTSNGMTKLLHEYPKNQQEDILDFLFAPNFGASLQTLKVEIGSDANGTCGTEPSHMRSETDFDITRGVGLWLAKEAKKRNEAIFLDAIRWGTPAWVTDKDKKYQYYLKFLQGARSVYSLDFDYLAPDENEGAYSIDWVVNVLRPGLDRDGYAHVKLSGADSTEDWNIVPIIKGHPDVRKSISALTRHYKQDSPQYAKECGLPIYNSEDIAPFRNSFSFALDMAYKIIRSYASGKMVQYVMHPVIEAIYDNVPYTCKSILLAANPWTGHFVVQAGLWVVAHFTQFIHPGWVFIDSACIDSPHCSCLALQHPNTKDISIILLNRSKSIKQVTITFKDVVVSYVKVWKTNEKEQFCEIDPLAITHDALCITLEPLSIYTLTTTSGQQKGCAKFKIPEETKFPLPYLDDFNTYEIGKQPRYTIDQAGAFEICAGGRNGGKCLKQVLTNSMRPQDWERRPTPLPYTILGGQELSNYAVSIDFNMEQMPERNYEGYALLGARCNHASAVCEIPECYNVRLFYDGRWFLSCGQIVLSSGRTQDFSLGSWNSLALHCEQKVISAYYNGVLLDSIEHEEIPSGNIVIGSAYSHVRYDNLEVTPIENLPDSCNRYSILDYSITLSGNWEKVGNDSDNYYRTLLASSERGSEIDFIFRGTSLSIIGVLDNESGRAEVYIDGKKVSTIDAFCSSRKYRKSLFSVFNLPHGQHRFKMMVLGEQHEDSMGSRLSVNAVETSGDLMTFTD